ncbi:3-hydroxyacyl-CoA dehydrogenase [Sphingobium chlorophenolicum L-1]|uniref:3-hydroxyacyl-CoA dehydrogenase n=1 Tax=Sphingobium chlorophenolicum L-1 TaxID=690566 RepID=F6F1P7_SPHCR|nr:SDR family NAD(P)-dependent oxidoreductase [Sphingobium chlorophenolicum]AEG51463.1 3-hydroxyacyl-CoA dehydrogenase [Sphingobium chlorophenolicum L-1]
MTVDLTGRVAVITGSGAGLGREYALLLSKLGAKIVVNDLGGAVDGQGASTAAADNVVAEIVAAGGSAVANYDSVTDPEGGKRIVATALDAFGKIDIVINNAGILRDRSFIKMTPQEFSDVINVHLFGAFNVTHAAWPHLIAQNYGRVVMTTSAGGHNGNFGQSNYGAAKLALVGMMNCLALEGKKHNVLVNAISPAALTRMTENIPTGDIAQYLKPELVAPAVAWLSSEQFVDSGVILATIAGFYSRIAYFDGPGRQYDPLEPVTADMLAQSADAILALEGAKPVQPGPLGETEARLRAIGRL